MDWVERPHNYKGLYVILQFLQGSHLDNFALKTLKLGWEAFHSAGCWNCDEFYIVAKQNEDSKTEKQNISRPSLKVTIHQPMLIM